MMRLLLSLLAAGLLAPSVRAKRGPLPLIMSIAFIAGVTRWLIV